MRIPFNKPFLTGKETDYIKEAVNSGKISGNGIFTKKCQDFFQDRYHFKKCLLTTSCTDALEMAALLLRIEPGDEVIVPTYTFVSSANAFILRGAKIVFADSMKTEPCVDPASIRACISKRTKAIVVVHYAGIACNMDEIMALAKEHGLYVVEDAAHAIDSFYKGRPLGGIGHLGVFSFHETKNIISGEGGMLVINDEQFAARAEILWEKGTDRSAFFRGEVDKYGWMDVGSSFLPSEVISAFLFAQLENLDAIQKTRCALWERYHKALEPLAKKGHFQIPHIPDYAVSNGHLYYLICRNGERDALIRFLRQRGILLVFHYQSLHQSPFYRDRHDGRPLPNADRYSADLVRLPLFYSLSKEEQEEVIRGINDFFNS